MTDTNDIRLVACDIDGTLVLGGKVVSPELQDIFAALSRQGVTTALCTGRMPHWTEGVADELGVTDYLICTEGGHVLHRPTRRRIHYATLAPPVVDAVAELTAAEPELSVAALCDDLIRTSSEEAGQRAHWWGFRREPVTDIRDAIDAVLLVVFGPHGLVDQAYRSLRDRFAADQAVVHDIEAQHSYAQIKVCAPGADKGVGAERLIRHLGGEMSHVLAFGDYFNDLPVMRRAGLSICPRDAHPLVRDTAMYVSAYSAAEGFVARELRKLFNLNR